MAMQDVGRGVKMFKALISGYTAAKIGGEYGISSARVMQLSQWIHRMLRNPKVFNGTTEQNYHWNLTKLRGDAQFWNDLADKFIAQNNRV